MAHTHYRAEEEDDEKIIDVIHEDEKDERNIDADDEDFDDEEEEDDENQDNKDKQETIKAALEKERRRAQALTNLEKQAKHLGVSFNATKAIQSGMSVEKAKNAVLTAAISKSSSLKLSTTVPHSDRASKTKIYAKWEEAWRAIK